MSNDLPVGGEPDRGPAKAPSDGEPQAPAEPRSVQPESLRRLIFKHAHDRRTLDRVLLRMRSG